MSEYRIENQWPNTENARSFMLFAERCRELVSPEVDDIYRVHALSTPRKFQELQIQCHRTQATNLPKKSLDTIVEEVEESLINEPVAKEVIGKKIETRHVLPRSSDTIDEISSKSLLLNGLIQPKYIDIAEKQIISACSKTTNRNSIVLLANLYVAEVINRGYSRRFIHEMVQRHFFEKRVGRCDRHLLNRFFSEFSKGGQEFEVILLGNARSIKTFEAILPIASELSHSALSSLRYRLVQAQLANSPRKKAITLKRINAQDQYTALKIAEELLTFYRAQQFIYPNSPEIQIDDKCFVVSEGDISFELDRLKVRSFFPSKTAKRYRASNKNFSDFLMGGLRQNQDKVFSTLMRAFNSATLSLDSAEPETRLLSIWAAFEALLPPPSREDREKARILHFADLIAPASTHGYLRGKYRIAYSACYDAFGDNFKQVVNDHGKGNSDGERLASLLIGDRSHLEILNSTVEWSPLFCNRLASLRRLLMEPSRAIEKTKKHEKRVHWQIHRIYRERNNLVHSGQPSPYLNILVENAELYFRLTVRGLEQVVLHKEVFDPHSALQYIRALRLSRLQRLEKIAKIGNSHIARKKFISAIFS